MSRVLDPAMHLPGIYTTLGYKSAAVERKSGGPLPTGGSADYQARQDRELLSKIAQRFDRDNGIYEGILNRFCDAVLGPDGFTLHPDTGNQRLNTKITDDWAGFCEAPEVRKSFDWLECQKLGLRSIANDGDVGAEITNRERFRFTEAEEIVSPKGNTVVTGAIKGNVIDQGVELDAALGAPVAYFIAPRSPQGWVQRNKARRIPDESFVFAANRKRFSQTRGIPILTSTFSMIHRINDVCDSEAIAWQNLAKFALTITRERSAEQAFNESRPDASKVAHAGDPETRVMELAEAILFMANPGETIQAVERNLPGRDFPESVRMFLRLIGLPVGIPLEVILLDYSKSNYTSSRAALEQAFRMFVAWQRWLKKKFHTPIYRAWLTWRIAAGAYPDKLETRKHSWGAPEFPWVDQLKESEAWGARLDRGLATQSMALRSVNLDFDDYIAKRSAEVERAIKESKRIEAANPGVVVPWQVFAGIPASKQASGPGVKTGEDPESQDPNAQDGGKPQ